jgi:hypothetical protein
MSSIVLRATSATLLLFLGACTATTLDTAPTKEEAERLYAEGKADGVDWCDELGWYGDDICDPWCPLEDQDCTGGECTVGADSTCGEGQSCIPGVCYDWSDAAHPGDCEPATCVTVDRRFCPTALCPPGWRCDEEEDRCEPNVDDFCTVARCPGGTHCDEERDECVANERDFCPTALCGPLTRCDEELDRCVPISSECPTVMCALFCPDGFRTGDDGCPICACNEPSTGCKRSGCSGQLCIPEEADDVITTCEFPPAYGCLDHAVCERQVDGSCGFTETPAYEMCMASFD